MTVHQGIEWLAGRAGHFTASRMADILAVGVDKWKVLRPTGTVAKSCDTEAEAARAMVEMVAKARVKEGWQIEKVPGEPLKGWQDYLADVVCERLTGEPTTTPETFAMRWGKDMEPHAMERYEQKLGTIVQQCGFIPCSLIDLAGSYGASPDGLVEDDGQIEIKCPHRSSNHLRCFTHGVPEEHLPQIQGQLVATGRAWCDFISYDPRMPPHLRLYTHRVAADPDWAERITQAVLFINRAAEEMMDQLPQPEEGE